MILLTVSRKEAIVSLSGLQAIPPPLSDERVTARATGEPITTSSAAKDVVA
jgi:hypothetical protein